MKKLLALLLAAVLLAASAVGFAEEAGGAEYAALVLSDPIVTMKEDGSEMQFDLTGLSLALEAASTDAETLLGATLYGPENVAAAVKTLISGEQLILAMDGLSKAFLIDIAEMVAAAENLTGLATTVDFEAMVEELVGMISISEIAEPQDVEFLNGTAAATGMCILVPREALEYIGLYDATEKWGSDDLSEVTVEGVELVIWASDSMTDLRFDLALALNDGSEFPLAALLALDETGENGSFAAYANGAQFLSGGFETGEHIVFVTGVVQTDETETPVTVELEFADEQPNGSDSYDAKRISLSVTEDGENYEGVEVYLSSANHASLYTFTIVVDGTLVQLGYDGTDGIASTGAHETRGKLFFTVTDGKVNGNTIDGEIIVTTVSGTTIDQLPDMSGLQLLTLEDMENIDEDSELMNEVTTVLTNAVLELQKIPLIGEILEETAEY